jgi:3-methyladenine DNA glycosylase AlkD
VTLAFAGSLRFSGPLVEFPDPREANMNTVAEVLSELKKYGTEQTRKTFARHGADVSRMYGVKVGDMKKIVKQIKGDQELALQLYDSGILDAQYLAGLVADGSRMTLKQLEGWAKTAGWQMVSDYTVPWVASENEAGRELAMKWIASKKESLACCGWATYSAIVAITPDSELDLDEIESLMQQIKDKIHRAPNRVKYATNNFIIAVGCYVKPLNALAKSIAKSIGKVEVDMGDTSCKVPDALNTIAKVESMKRVGQKRKTARC